MSKVRNFYISLCSKGPIAYLNAARKDWVRHIRSAIASPRQIVVCYGGGRNGVLSLIDSVPAVVSDNFVCRLSHLACLPFFFIFGFCKRTKEKQKCLQRVTAAEGGRLNGEERRVHEYRNK